MKTLSNLDKQLTAFEIMSQPLDVIEFDDKFFDSLLHELFIPKSPQTFVKGFEMQNSIFPIKILRDLSNKIRKRSTSSETARTLVETLKSFLKQFQFAKSLKKYYDEKVYASIYVSCFDPVEFALPSIPNQITNDITGQGNFFITEIESSSSLTELVKIENKKRIIQISKDLFDLNLRWNKVLDEENTDSTVLEVETRDKLNADQSRLKMCKSIFIDLSLKTKSAVTMLREWMSLFKKWINCNSYSANGTEFNHDLVKRVNNIRKSLEKLKEDINTLENIIMHIKRDNESLEIKENNLIQYVNKKEDIILLRDAVNNEYECLLSRRIELINSLNYCITGTSKYEKLSGEISGIEEIINKKFMELKSLNYSAYITSHDSDEIMTSLKDFVRWSDSGQQILAERKLELEGMINERIKCEAFLDEVYQNIYRIKFVVGSKYGDLSGLFDNSSIGDYRPLTSNTYTIDDKNIRFKDMNVT